MMCRLRDPHPSIGNLEAQDDAAFLSSLATTARTAMSPRSVNFTALPIKLTRT